MTHSERTNLPKKTSMKLPSPSCLWRVVPCLSGSIILHGQRADEGEEGGKRIHSSNTHRVMSGFFMSILPRKSMKEKLSTTSRWRRCGMEWLYASTLNLNDVSGMYRVHSAALSRVWRYTSSYVAPRA